MALTLGLALILIYVVTSKNGALEIAAETDMATPTTKSLSDDILEFNDESLQ
jgi:hypothetical protein